MTSRSGLDRLPSVVDPGAMTASRPSPTILSLAGLAHLVVTTLAWRDLQRRPSSGIRGPRTLWKVLTAMNTANSLLYLLVGIRR